MPGVDTSDIRYDIMTAADVEPAIRLIAEAFSSSEPPAVAVALSVADLTAFLRLLAPQAVSDGLTPLARSGTGEVIGVMLTDDFAAPLPIDPARISQRFRPILGMLESLDEQYRGGRDLRAGECLHLFMLAVDPRFGGRGIARQLVETCLQNGIRKGYRSAVTEATGRLSQRVFAKLGFQEHFRTPYKTYRFEGLLPFETIAEHGGAALMERSLARGASL